MADKLMRTVIVMSFFLILALFSECGTKGTQITDADNGTQITVKSGDLVTLTLVSNPTTGFSWQVMDIDNAILVQDGEPEYKQSPGSEGLVGAGGTETFRQRLNNLVRRTPTLARRSETLVTGMYIVGCFYNFCDFHHSLREKLWVGSHGYRWVQRTPAIAARLTDHQWTPSELFAFKVPPTCWKPPARRGRPSLATLQLAQRWAA